MRGEVGRSEGLKGKGRKVSGEELGRGGWWIGGGGGLWGGFETHRQKSDGVKRHIGTFLSLNQNHSFFPAI